MILSQTEESENQRDRRQTYLRINKNLKKKKASNEKYPFLHDQRMEAKEEYMLW